MSSCEKIALRILMGMVVLSGLALSGCSSLNDKNPEIVSLQAENAAATIDRQAARDRLTSTEAATAKDSLEREHILQF